MVSSSLKTIGIMTIASSILWTILSIYTALIKPVDLDVDPALLVPIRSTLDLDTLNSLRDRRQFTQDGTSDQVLSQALTILAIEPATADTPAPTDAPEPETPPIENAETDPIVETPAEPTL